MFKQKIENINKKIGVYSSCVNFIAVICFAMSMLFDFDYGSYFFSMFIAFSFVAMVCGYAHFAEKEVKTNQFIDICCPILGFRKIIPQ